MCGWLARVGVAVWLVHGPERLLFFTVGVAVWLGCGWLIGQGKASSGFSFSGLESGAAPSGLCCLRSVGVGLARVGSRGGGTQRLLAAYISLGPGFLV